MKSPLMCAALAMALAAMSGSAVAESFTYHGVLEKAGAPASGQYDLKLTLYSAEQGGQVLAGPIEAYGVAVNAGAFSTHVDFGPMLHLDRTAWLGVEVKAGNSAFEALSGRSPIGPEASACPGSWALDGNAGNPAGAFMGTADAQSVTVKTNSTDGIYVIPKGIETPAVSLSPWSMYNMGVGATSVSAASGAAGAFSFAGGFWSEALHDGSFVWGDDLPNRGSLFSDSAANQFIIGAGGGVGINTNNIGGWDDLVIKARTSGDADVDLLFYSRSDKKGRIYVRDTDGKMFLSADGGVQTSNLVVDGEMDAKALNVEGNAVKSTAGSWKANSDGRIKQDITPVEHALDTLAKLRPVTFRYSDAYRGEHKGIADQRYYNVIAQEFAQVFPDAVQGSGEYLPGAAKTAANEILQVDTYPALITTVAAVQELAAENAALKAQLKQLGERLDQLTAKGE